MLGPGRVGCYNLTSMLVNDGLDAALVRSRTSTRHAHMVWVALLLLLGSAAAIVAFAVCYPFSEMMPVPSHGLPAPPVCGAWCRNASSHTPCVYDGACTSSHGRDFCHMNCGRWRAGADMAVPSCSCIDFCRGACWAPTCVPCPRACLPLWIRDTPSPLGTGILCCPGCGDPCEPCCGNHSAMGRCCELHAPPQGCACDDPPPTPSQVLAESSERAKQALLPLVATAALVSALSAWVSLESALWSPRSCARGRVVCWPQQLLLLGALAVTVALQLVLKAHDWEVHAKPQELLYASWSGSTAVMLLALALAPKEVHATLLRRLRPSYSRAVVLHRSVGMLAVAAVSCHATLEAYAHLATSLQTYQFQGRVGAFGRAAADAVSVLLSHGLHAWGLGNVFGVVAAGCLLISMGGVALRRWSYEFFAYSHAACSLLALVAGCLHAFELIPVATLLVSWHAVAYVHRRRRRIRTHGRMEVVGGATLITTTTSAMAAHSVGCWFLLRVPALDRAWHPYSNVATLCSGAGSARLAFLCVPEPLASPGRPQRPASSCLSSWSHQLLRTVCERAGFGTDGSDSASAMAEAMGSGRTSAPTTVEAMGHERAMAVCSLPVELEGPYGTMLGDLLSRKRLLLVAGGSGVLGVLSHFAARGARGAGGADVQLHWATRSAGPALDWLDALLAPGASLCGLSMYVTGVDGIEADAGGTTARCSQAGCGADPDHATRHSVAQHAQARGLAVHHGRPCIRELVAPLGYGDAILCCGPRSLTHAAQLVCPVGVELHVEEFLW